MRDQYFVKTSLAGTHTCACSRLICSKLPGMSAKGTV